MRHLDRLNGLLSIEGKLDPRAKRLDRPKTVAGVRTVEIGPAAIVAFDQFLITKYGSVEAAPVDAFLLDGLNTERLRRNKTNGWRRMLQQEGVDRHMSLYSCRHFFASHHLAKGRSLAWVAKQMGHSSVPVTLSHYTDGAPGRQPGGRTEGLRAGTFRGQIPADHPRHGPTGPERSARNA